MSTVSRRGFLGLAGAAGLTAGLAACAGSGTSSSSGASGSAGAAANTIEFWSNHPGTSKDTEQKIIDAFQAKHPGLTVKLVDAGKSYEEVQQKFNAALTGGSLPDVVVVSDVTWFNFALNKQLTSLDSLASANGVKPDEFVPALYNDYKYKDGHYAFPYSRSTPLFYYNKDLWSKAGLPDRGPQTWDEFKEWSAKLKPVLPSGAAVFNLSDGSNYLDWIFQNIVWDFGGAYSKEWTPTFTDPATIKAGQYLQDMAKSGVAKFSKTPENDFGAGLGAALMASTGSLGTIAKAAKFPFGTAFLPGTDNCPTGGAGVAIPAGISDERKKNALSFIDFLTSTPETIIFSQATGYMPVRTAAQADPAETAYLAQNPNAQTAVKQLPHTRSQDNARVFVPGGGARIGKALDQICQGADVTATFTQLNADTQQVIDSQLKSKLG